MRRREHGVVALLFGKYNSSKYVQQSRVARARVMDGEGDVSGRQTPRPLIYGAARACVCLHGSISTSLLI